MSAFIDNKSAIAWNNIVGTFHFFETGKKKNSFQRRGSASKSLSICSISRLTGRSRPIFFGSVCRWGGFFSYTHAETLSIDCPLSSFFFFFEKKKEQTLFVAFWFEQQVGLTVRALLYQVFFFFWNTLIRNALIRMEYKYCNRVSVQLYQVIKKIVFRSWSFEA